MLVTGSQIFSSIKIVFISITMFVSIAVFIDCFGYRYGKSDCISLVDESGREGTYISFNNNWNHIIRMNDTGRLIAVNERDFIVIDCN